MSSDRALRKQQQLNNLVYVVTNQAKPGDRIVDFCSGGVWYLFTYIFSLSETMWLYITFKDMLLFGKIVISGWAETLGTNFNLSLFLPLLGSPWDYACPYAALMPGKVWITDQENIRKQHDVVLWAWLISALWVYNHSLESDVWLRHFLFSLN